MENTGDIHDSVCQVGWRNSWSLLLERLKDEASGFLSFVLLKGFLLFFIMGCQKPRGSSSQTSICRAVDTCEAITSLDPRTFVFVLQRATRPKTFLCSTVFCDTESPLLVEPDPIKAIPFNFSKSLFARDLIYRARKGVFLLSTASSHSTSFLATAIVAAFRFFFSATF